MTQDLQINLAATYSTVRDVTVGLRFSMRCSRPSEERCCQARLRCSLRPFLLCLLLGAWRSAALEEILIIVPMPMKFSRVTTLLAQHLKIKYQGGLIARSMHLQGGVAKVGLDGRQVDWGERTRINYAMSIRPLL